MNKECNNCNCLFTNRDKRSVYCSMGCYRVFQKENPNSGTFKKGRKLTDYEKRKIGDGGVGRIAFFKGKKLPILMREKMSISHKKRVQEGKNNFWKGGVTNINRLIRTSSEYKVWRESVFKRDNWTCVFCEKRGLVLNADHIKPFAYYPELRFAIDNGRTLCVACHKGTDTWGEKAKHIKIT